MKYSVGDVVKVIDDLSRSKRYPYSRYGSSSSEMDVSRDMENLAGQKVTIHQVNESGTYNICELGGTSWVDSMFDSNPSTQSKTLKVGDKVRLLDNLGDKNKYYYVDPRDNSKHHFDMRREMARLSGQEAIITRVDNDGTFRIDLDDDDNWWCTSMFNLNETTPSQTIELKVGDKVKVIDNLENCRYYYTDKKSGNRESFSTYSKQRDLSGTFVTIAKVDTDGTYKVSEDGVDNWWCDSMFDLNTVERGAKQVSGRFEYNGGRLVGSCIRRFSNGDRVKLIPFIKYNDESIYFLNPKNRERVSRDCYRNLKKLILKDLKFCRDYDDGDAEIQFKNDYGDWESVYAPMCCLMPKDMKVRDLPKPADSDMGRLYDAYVSKYEPIQVVPDVVEEPASIAEPKIELTAEIVGSLSMSMTKAELTKYLGGTVHCSVNKFDIIQKIKKKFLETAEFRLELAEETFSSTDNIKLKSCIKDNTVYKIRGEKVFISDVERYRGKVIAFSDCQDEGKEIRFYHNGVIHVNYKDLFEKTENKKNMNDESEEIKMSKLGLGGMLTRMFGEVGEVTDGSLALTFGGAVAVRRKDGDFVRYDADGENIENQGNFILEGSSKFMILMPSPTVAAGDIIKHKGKFLQVLEVKANGSLSTVNHESGTKTTVLKETNLFGMQFYTKVMSMMTGMAGTDGTTPGGFNPLMMLMLSKDEEGSESKMDMTTMLMLSGMFGGQGATGQMNPMMMMALLGDKEGGESGSGMKDMMMMSMFMGGNSPFGTMFGQTPAPVATLEVAEPIKTAPGLEALCQSQAEAIVKLNETITGLTAQIEKITAGDVATATATGKASAKKAATTDK